MKSREGKIKRAGAVMSFFAVGCTSFSVSCTGLDRHLHNTINPFGNPNTPDARSETAQRIQGAKATSTMPLLPEEGDVWPGQPEPVPSLQDVSRSDAHFVAKWQKARPQLDADLRQQLNDGQGMSVGEDVGKRYGSGRDVMPIGQPIPSHVKDNAPPYIEPANKGVVTIPNGDGTDTLIAPDGSVKIVSAGKAALYQNARTFGHVRSSDEQTQEAQAETEKTPVTVPPPPPPREQVVTEAPHPQRKVERLPEPEPQRLVHEVPPVREVPPPQPKAEVRHEVQQRPVHEAPPVRAVPPHSEAHVVIPPPAPKAPVVAEPPPQQPAIPEAAPRHRYDRMAVDAAQPVAEPAHIHKSHHKQQARDHEAVAVSGRHHKTSERPVEAHAKKERHHTHRKRNGEFVDALGLEASARSARAHKSDGVYQFDWDK